MFPWWPSTKIVQAIMIHKKTWQVGGWTYFSFISFFKNFKNLLVRNHGTDFSITGQKCSFGDLMAARGQLGGSGGGGLFWLGRGRGKLILTIENFKNIFVSNHWTDFSIIWLIVFIGDPLPRLFKLSWFIKIHGRQCGQGLFLLHIYIENFKNLLVRNYWTDCNITWKKCFFGDPLPKIGRRHDLSKNMAARGPLLSYER